MSLNISILVWGLKLKSTLKLTLLALADYSNDEGLCFPSVSALTEKTCLTRTTIINNLKKLQEIGLIKKKKRYSDGKRYSNVYSINIELGTDSVRTDSLRTNSVRTNSVRTDYETVSTESVPTSIYDSHITVNTINTSVEKKYRQKHRNKLYKKYAVEILNFLNEKTERDYKQTEANLGMITARLKEFEKFKTIEEVVEDCRMVIAKRCREWEGDEKMHTYLRPATLFDEIKFSQYQGELVCKTG